MSPRNFHCDQGVVLLMSDFRNVYSVGRFPVGFDGHFAEMLIALPLLSLMSAWTSVSRTKVMANRVTVWSTREVFRLSYLEYTMSLT